MTMLNKPVGIIGTGSYVPEKVLTNADLEKMVDTSDAWIQERTGIKERRIAPEGVNASDMATEAAKKALEAANLTAEDLDCIIVATLTGDMAIPSTACLVQANLGATKAAAFDLSAACSGFVYSMITASTYVNAGLFKNVLVVGVEVLSRVVNWEDRNTCVLFGDGAGAAVVSSVEEGLTFVHMNGQEVYKFAVKTMGKTVLKALEMANMGLEELDFFIPHQANTRIIKSAADRLHLTEDKVFINLPKYGNTSAASIAIALDEAVRAGKLQKGDNLAVAGFGAGLTWASLVMKWC